MILDAYFRFERLNPAKKSRFDLVATTEPDYSPLCNPSKAGEVWVYLTHFQKSNGRREPDVKLSSRDSFVSGLFFPMPEKPQLGFGDVKRTADALLFVLDGDRFEAFLAKGKKHLVSLLFNQLVDGELDREIEVLRTRAEGQSPAFNATDDHDE